MSTWLTPESLDKRVKYLDALSRTRALTDAESVKLERYIRSQMENERIQKLRAQRTAEETPLTHSGHLHDR